MNANRQRSESVDDLLRVLTVHVPNPSAFIHGQPRDSIGPMILVPKPYAYQIKCSYLFDDDPWYLFPSAEERRKCMTPEMALNIPEMDDAED